MVLSFWLGLVDIFIEYEELIVVVQACGGQALGEHQCNVSCSVVQS